jgi:hypothetical protein
MARLNKVHFFTFMRYEACRFCIPCVQIQSSASSLNGILLGICHNRRQCFPSFKRGELVGSGVFDHLVFWWCKVVWVGIGQGRERRWRVFILDCVIIQFCDRAIRRCDSWLTRLGRSWLRHLPWVLTTIPDDRLAPSCWWPTLEDRTQWLQSENSVISVLVGN